jgi:tetratricopeptide (TPR) repeat protein
VPRLIISRGETIDRELDLANRDLRIGRGDQNDVVLTDPSKSVSRFHAELRHENGGYALIDLNSQNGLWVHGRKEQKVVLEPGVPVIVGSYTLMLAGASSSRNTDELVSAPATARPTTTSDTLVPGSDKRPPGKPAPPSAVAGRAKGAAAARPAAAKPGAPPSPGLIAALARLPKPMLFGGFALFMMSVMALGQFFGPADKAGSVVTQTPVEARKPVSPSNTQLRDQHVATARSLLENNDYDGAMKELDDALIAMPGDPTVVELKARTMEGRTAGVGQVGPQTDASETAASGATAPATGVVANPPAAAPAPPPATNPSPVSPVPAVERPSRNARESAGPPLSITCRPGEKRADCAARDRDLAERLDRARSAIDAGSFQQAIAQLTEIVREEPAYKDVATLIGRAREGVHSAGQQALDAATKAESGGDLVNALQHYQRAPQIDAATAVVAEEGARRVGSRMKTEAADAFTRAKQYDALGRSPEAIALYERAFRYLPDDDANKKVAKDRLDALRLRQ